MKLKFTYNDGTEMTFRGIDQKECVEQADKFVNEHDMVSKIEDVKQIKGFDNCDSRNWIELRNGLLAQVKDISTPDELSKYDFNIWEPDEDGFRGKLISGGIVENKDLVNDSILSWLDENYGCKGTNFNKDAVSQNIIIDENSAFATVGDDYIDFKFCVELDQQQYEEVEKAYGKDCVNSVLAHAFINKEGRIERVEVDFYLKELFVLERDDYATKELLSPAQREKICNYARMYFIGREKEFDLSDSTKETLDNWKFDKAYANSFLCEIKDFWIDNEGSEFYVLVDRDEDNEEYFYAKVISMYEKNTLVLELGFDEVDRQTVEGMYINEISEREINRQEARVYEELDKEQCLVTFGGDAATNDENMTFQHLKRRGR